MRYKPGKRAVIIDHVGNYARFGMPDADRNWTLEGRKKSHPKSAVPEAEEVHVLQCPECFYTFEKPDTEEIRCPECGYLFPGKERRVIQDDDGKLEKITGFTLAFDSPEQCQTMQELQAYAKKHGYKPGWCYYQAKQRGWL